MGGTVIYCPKCGSEEIRIEDADTKRVSMDELPIRDGYPYGTTTYSFPQKKRAVCLKCGYTTEFWEPESQPWVIWCGNMSFTATNKDEE